MPQFLFVYRAPSEYKGSPSTGEQWHKWFESLGASLQDIGNPVFSRASTGNDSGETVLGGYSIVDADDLNSAVTLAEGCPFVELGGGVEVGELTVVYAGGIDKRLNAQSS